MNGLAPVIIAHRGASGYRPEHTLASYRLAIEMGADYIEPDLVPTRDGVLVARHENEIGGTTDVAEHREFAGRRTTKTVDGRQVTGWFTEDFTLAELKTLRAKERLPRVRPANTWYDGHFEVPTLEEILDLVERAGRRRGVTVGVYPETKHPTYFDSIGLSLEEPLVEALRRHHLDRPNAPVLLQSFETGNLRELAAMTSVPLVQLVEAGGAPYDLEAAGDPRCYADLLTPSGLREVATYAAGAGPAQEPRAAGRRPHRRRGARRRARGARVDGARREPLPRGAVPRRQRPGRPRRLATPRPTRFSTRAWTASSPTTPTPPWRPAAGGCNAGRAGSARAQGPPEHTRSPAERPPANTLPRGSLTSPSPGGNQPAACPA